MTEDQAAGLRRMFVRRRAGMASFAGGAANCGSTSLVLATAQALVEAGERVTVIDEHQGSGSISTRLGVTTRFDLLQAVNRDAGLALVRRRASNGVAVVAAARLAALGDGLTRLQVHALNELLDEIYSQSDWVLVDAAASRAGMSPLARRAQRWIISTNSTGPSLTGAYALVKRASHETSVGVAVRRNRNGLEGTRIYTQLAEVAQAHLGRMPEWLGEMPAPPQWCEPGPLRSAGDTNVHVRAMGEKLMAWLDMRGDKARPAVESAGQVTVDYLVQQFRMNQP